MVDNKKLLEKEELEARRRDFDLLRRGAICQFGEFGAFGSRKLFLVDGKDTKDSVCGVELTPRARENILGGKHCSHSRLTFDEMPHLRLLG